MPAGKNGTASEDGRQRAGVWHSAKAHVHHNNPRCTSGRLVRGRNLRPGDGGKPLCEQCQVLNQYA